MHFIRHLVALIALSTVVGNAFSRADEARLRVSRFVSATSVELTDGKSFAVTEQGARFGRWTLMAIVHGNAPYVVVEDFEQRDGPMMFIASHGILLELPKTSEASSVDAKSLYLGRSPTEILASDRDVLADELLASKREPNYADIAAVFPPLKNIRGGTFAFIGTPNTSEKIGLSYGGRTPHFDPAVYEPSIRRVREEQQVWHGLAGGYLPVMRFVYPDAITNVLLSMRTQALTRPANDPAFGMLAGWSEADSALDPEPARYMQPYISNSTEAARGFRDLGRAWQTIGEQAGDQRLIAWGSRLIEEAKTLREDIERSIERSTLMTSGNAIIPAIAGVTEPFHAAVQRDRLDPQHRSYRAYMEMMHSGSLTAMQTRLIVDYRAQHRDVLLGIPTAYHYGSREVAGFLLYGHVYGLIQHDMIREALLATYSDLAHQYTRGMWLAPETRRPLLDADAAPYCVPAQLFAPLVTRWLLAFEDSESETLWLAKAIPRAWLDDGKRVAATGVATRWGRIDFTIDSRLRRKSINATIAFPAQGIAAETRLRVRAPSATPLKSVTLNGKRWTQFDPSTETITLPPRTQGTVQIVAAY